MKFTFVQQSGVLDFEYNSITTTTLKMEYSPVLLEIEVADDGKVLAGWLTQDKKRGKTFLRPSTAKEIAKFIAVLEYFENNSEINIPLDLCAMSDIYVAELSQITAGMRRKLAFA